MPSFVLILNYFHPTLSYTYIYTHSLFIYYYHYKYIRNANFILYEIANLLWNLYWNLFIILFYIVHIHNTYLLLLNFSSSPLAPHQHVISNQIIIILNILFKSKKKITRGYTTINQTIFYTIKQNPMSV